MAAVDELTLVLPGPTRTRKEPEYRVRGRFAQVYPHATTKAAMKDWQGAWTAAGRPVLHPDCPLAMTLEFIRDRPPSHYLPTGELRLDAKRQPIPMTKPDNSNAMKVAEDSLNGLAWTGDELFAFTQQLRRWTVDGEPERTVLRAWVLLRVIGGERPRTRARGAAGGRGRRGGGSARRGVGA